MKESSKKEKAAAKDNCSMPGLASENGNELGVIKVHENVIVSIVRKATCSVEGVVRLAGNTLVDNIAEIVGSRKISDRAISVTIDGPNVGIEVKVNVLYGAHVPSVASEVQKQVSEKVEAMTGMTVDAVNVVVQELEDASAKEEEEEEKEEK
jgi:uncharacterized alkaline shock family protein YloU